MTGLYLGLDDFLPSTPIEIVNTCADFTIEAVKNKNELLLFVYSIYIYI